MGTESSDIHEGQPTGDDDASNPVALYEQLHALLDQLDVDPALVEMLEASVHGNVSTILHVLSNDIPVEHLQPTTAAVEYALRLAQRDVPSNSLVRAYHMGQNEMLRIIFGYVDELDLSKHESLVVMRRISDVVSQYIEWITLYVFQAYEDERRRWIGAEGNVLSSRIHEILRTPDVDADSFERESGYSLDQHHVAVIMWSDDEGSRDLAVLDRAARMMATKLFAEGPPLITAIDRTTAWVWLPLGRGDRSVQTAEVDRASGAIGGAARGERAGRGPGGTRPWYCSMSAVQAVL